MPNAQHPLVGIVMGSKSDWDVMQFASLQLQELNVPHEKRVISAHRTPERIAQYCTDIRKSTIKVLIAGAGGAAHLPGMLASHARPMPVIGVPTDEVAISSILRMPSGIPVNTMPPGKPGAMNAAIAAAEILGISHPEILRELEMFFMRMHDAVDAMDIDVIEQ